MKYTYFCLIMLLINISSPVDAQQFPEPPTLNYVTVDPETGYDIIYWYPSPSDFANFYAIRRPSVIGTGDTEIATVDSSYTMWTNVNPESSLGSIEYSIVAINDLGSGIVFKSSGSQRHGTIFLQATFDSCMASITLNWNDYNIWRGSIAEYNIYRRLAPFIYEKLATVSEGVQTTELTNLGVNQQYELFVEAVHTDGRKSTSNKVVVITNLSQQPGRVNADYATISQEGSVSLSFTIINPSSQSNYILMRGNNAAGDFTQIGSFNTNDQQIAYTDDVPFTSGVYFYRLDGINNCGLASPLSNTANNIILNGTLSGNNVSIAWNEYLNWSGGVEQYKIIRVRGRQDAVTDTLDMGLLTNYSEDISNMANYENPVSSLICYEVMATENRNVYGIQGKSFSNKLCFSINPDIRIPNAFIPNDTEPMNQVFEPVFSFQPEHYDMIIYNRLGTKIWEGSQAWDGRVNGKYVPEGVYLYYLRVFNYSTDISEFNGKVTVVYR